MRGGSALLNVIRESCTLPVNTEGGLTSEEGLTTVGGAMVSSRFTVAVDVVTEVGGAVVVVVPDTVETEGDEVEPIVVLGAGGCETGLLELPHPCKVQASAPRVMNLTISPTRQSHETNQRKGDI